MADINSTAKEILFAFEQKYNPYEFRALGFPTWLLVREPMYNFIRGVLSNSHDYQISAKIGRNLTYVLRRVCKYWRNRELTKEQIDVAFVSNASFRRGTASSPCDNIFIDTVLDFLPPDLRYVVIEYPTLTDFDEKLFGSRYDKRTLPLDLFVPQAWFNLQLLRFQRDHYRKEIERLFAFPTHSVKRIMVPAEDELITFAKAVLLQETIKYVAATRAFARVFQCWTPKVVVDIAGASRFTYPYWGKTAYYLEIQHGVITEHHPGYIYPMCARESLKDFFDKRYLALYGKLYRDILISQSTWAKERLLITGNPRYSKLVLLDRRLFNKHLKNPLDQKILLFTSQPSGFVQNTLREFLNEMMKGLPNDYLVVIKLHPRESRHHNPYRRLEKQYKNVRVIAESPDLANLLYHSYLHISIASTIIQEAIYFGTPNVIIASAHSTETLDALVEQGAAIVVHNASELLELLYEWELRPESVAKMKNAQAKVKTLLFGEDSGDPASSIANLIKIICELSTQRQE